MVRKQKTKKLFHMEQKKQTRKKQKDVCEFCGEKLVLMCPNEWTKISEEAFQLGRKSVYDELLQFGKEKKIWK